MVRRTTITIETDSLLVLRERRSVWALCPHCGAEAEMIPLQDARAVSDLLSTEVQAIQLKGLHRTTTAEGTALICLNSILKRLLRAPGKSALGSSPPQTRENSFNPKERS